MTSHETTCNSPSGNSTEPENHRVLIVDDEPAILFAYRKLLGSERFGFDICESIDAAISLLNRNEYFAVISDVRFSGSDNEDGIYFVSVVRKEQPLAKVILVTGYGSDELKKNARELGASHYFEKPVMPSDILSLLRTMHLVADKNEENEYFKKSISR
jgi:DNA-binding NtrC family response regulator